MLQNVEKVFAAWTGKKQKQKQLQRQRIRAAAGNWCTCLARCKRRFWRIHAITRKNPDWVKLGSLIACMAERSIRA